MHIGAREVEALAGALRDELHAAVDDLHREELLGLVGARALQDGRAVDDRPAVDVQARAGVDGDEPVIAARRRDQPALVGLAVAFPRMNLRAVLRRDIHARLSAFATHERALATPSGRPSMSVFIATRVLCMIAAS